MRICVCTHVCVCVCVCVWMLFHFQLWKQSSPRQNTKNNALRILKFDNGTWKLNDERGLGQRVVYPFSLLLLLLHILHLTTQLAALGRGQKATPKAFKSFSHFAMSRCLRLLRVFPSTISGRSTCDTYDIQTVCVCVFECECEYSLSCFNFSVSHV